MDNLENNPEVETTEAEAQVETTESEEKSEKPSFISSEIVEVEWENLETLFKGKQMQNELNAQLANLCLQHERNKFQMLGQLQELDTFLYQQGSALKDGSNIDPELTYELKLPTEAGQKGFFIRKDS